MHALPRERAAGDEIVRMLDLQRPADGRDMDAHPHGIPDMGDILDLALSAAQNWT
jgi:hypothetical protein